MPGSEETAITFVIFLLCIAPYLIFTFLPLQFQGLVRFFATFYLFDDLHSYALSKSSLWPSATFESQATALPIHQGLPVTSLTPTLLKTNQLAVARCSGDEAAQFLQAQLTANIEAIPIGGCGLSGYCSPKGRLLAIFFVLRTASDFWLITGPQILDKLIKRLQMFILRAQVDITLNPAWQVGFSHVSYNGQNASLDLSQTPVEHRFPAVLPFVFTLNTEGIPGTMVQNAFSSAASDSNNTFRLACIQNGIPLIFLQTYEMFIPQSVNLDLIGGVSFQKGCYPGQEIVARVRYLGQLKTRMIRGAVKTASVIGPGTMVTGGGEESVQQGVVVDAAKNSNTGDWEVLASIPIAWLQGHFTAKTQIDRQCLITQPLPYDLGLPE